MQSASQRLAHSYASLYLDESSDLTPGDLQVIEVFVRFFNDTSELGGARLLDQVDLTTARSAVFEFAAFADAVRVSGTFADFETCLRERPNRILAHLGLALCICRARGAPPAHRGKITVRFVGLRPPLQLSNLKASMVGRLVSVSGYVVRVSSIQPLVVQATFECPKCGDTTSIGFEGGKYSPPSRCDNTQCRSKNFELRRDTATTVDFQTIKLQETDNDLADAGRVPRTVEVELIADLVDACIPGDLVTVVGVVKSVNSDLKSGKSGKRAMANSLFLLYVEANSITNSRQSSSGTGPQDFSKSRDNEEVSAALFSTDDLYSIRGIAHEPNCFEWICSSLCPSIFGHEHVKAGLILGLFGGSRPQSHARDRLSVRTDAHILVVGDPGLGKSQMLRAVSQVAPRSVYVCANTTTASGLTVTVSKEAGGSGDVALEAGALVLSDQGVCCIDEFDKIGCDHHCLLEAMEQQQVSVAKSGVVASLSARCSVIAAANPVGGHYDSGRTISENLKMSAPLLSRFDLAFILLDKPEELNDARISDHVMRTHGRAAGGGGGGRVYNSSSQHQAYNDVEQRQHEASEYAGDVHSETGGRVAMRIREVVAQSRRHPIAPEMLRKYIMYARKYIHPKLTGAAATVLQRLYLKIRNESRNGDAIPITTRQLESLVRLAQARARSELRDKVTESDALDVVMLMEESMLEAFSDEKGQLDFGRKGGMSLAKQAKTFIAELNKCASRKNSPLFSTNELSEIISRMNLKVLDVHSFLEMLNDQSFLLKKGGRMWELTTSQQSSSAGHSSQGKYRRRDSR